MATWPSASKASTANLDAGTDQPSLARADIRNNVDNVNSIIDSFVISTHSDGDILVWDSSNSRFEVTTPTDQVGITSIVAGTGITVTELSAGGVEITNTVTDSNTTYSIAAGADGSNANITLTGSDSSTDEVQLVAGSNVTLAVTSAGAIEISSTDTDTNTTYSISAETGTGGTNLRLTDSVAGTDDVLLAEGTGITVTRTDDSTITIATTVVDTNTTYTFSAETDGSNANLVLTGSDASTDSVQLVAGTNIALTVDSAGAVTITATDTNTGITSVVAGTGIAVDQTSEGGVTVSTTALLNIVEDTTPELGGNLAGAGNTISDVVFKDYRETIFELTTTSAGSINVDVADGPIQEINLTENVTFTGFVNAVNGQSVTLLLHQDGTGSRTFTESLSSASVMLFAGGDSTLTTAANATDIMTIVYVDGIYYASLAKDFS